jgi:hypothetical protein
LNNILDKLKRATTRIIGLPAQAEAREPSRRVLFVCMGNICRSPTAEGVFRKVLEERAPILAPAGRLCSAASILRSSVLAK